jgi:tetratricopeptide (TPR) repeat protein
MRRALLRCKGFALYFARCNTPALRTELVATLKENLSAPIVELTLNPENDSYIDAQMAQLLETAPENAIVFIYDIEKLFYLENRHLLAELNWRRGFYGRMNHPVVFWLPEFLLVELFNNSPDFMDWRSGVYEFSLSQPEQQNLMESTWQTANENFVEQLTLKEKQRWIVNLENLLSELNGKESETKCDLLNRLGELNRSLGNYEKALVCYQQNLQTQQLIHNKQGRGVTLNNISQIYHNKGDYDTALQYLMQSLEIDYELNDKRGESATLNNISQIYHDKGDYDIALQYLTQVLQIDYQFDDKNGESNTLNNISRIYQAKGDYDTALKYLMQSLKISQDVGNKAVESIVLNNISQIYSVKGVYNMAFQYLNQALKITQDIGDKRAECTVLFNVAHFYHQNGDRHQAQLTWIKAYKIAKQIGLAEGLKNLEQLAKQLGGTGLDFWEKLSQENTQGK